MAQNTKLWILFKKEWISNPEITDEALGQLLRGLHASVMPEHTIAKVMYTAVMQEYELINNYTKEAEKRISDRSRNAANARWGNAPVMLMHTLSNANIDTDKDTGKDKGIDIDKGIGDKELANILRSKLNKINQTEIGPYESLINGTFLE